MAATLRIDKALTPASLFLTGAVAALLAACGGGGMGMSSPTGMGMGMGCMPGMSGMSSSCMAPTVTMHSPGTTVHLTVTLAASASSMMMGDAVMRVDFLVDGTQVGSSMMPPYSVKWDTTTVGDGAHTLTASVMDSMDQTVTSAPVTVTVDNNPAFHVALAAAQIVPAPASSASGTATLSAKLASGALSGKVVLSGVSATALSINEAFAGNSGAALIHLTASGSAGEWDVPAGALLSAEQVTALLQGKLYVLAASAANPGGEIRGQITLPNVMVSFSDMSGMQEVPPVSIAATGVAATTVDSEAGTVSVHVHASGVADAMAGDLDSGAAGATGSKLAALAKDGVDPGHWSTELAPIKPDDLANFDASRWYVNVMTPAQPAGAIRGQIGAPAH
jgi:hypothetical protein